MLVQQNISQKNIFDVFIEYHRKHQIFIAKGGVHHFKQYNTSCSFANLAQFSQKETRTKNVYNCKVKSPINISIQKYIF